MKISKRSKITSSKETADRKTDRRIFPTNVRYKGYMIRLDRGGDGYNVYDKHGELEDAGYASIEKAKEFVDELENEAKGSYVRSSIDEDSNWRELASKSVEDSDGFNTDYTLYTNGQTYICMFGDKDLYEPDASYADYETESEQDAWDWFNSYTGFADEEDGEAEYYDILESTEVINESFSTKNVAKSKFKSINEDIDGTLNKLGGPETFRSELMATIEAYPGIEDDIEELADMMYGSYKGVISIEELESAIEYMIDDALESTEAVNSSYSPELLDDLVNFYSSFDTMSYEEIWDEIVVRYNNEALANDVLESLDHEEDLDLADEEGAYDVYSSSDIKASMGRYDEYYGQTAAATYGDLIADRLKGKSVSKRRDTANEPGGLIYEANKLGIDMWDLLEALEGMCNEGRAREIDDSTYKILGASDLADEEDLPQADQEYDSAKTSINSNKLPAIYHMITLPEGSVGIDYGGGKFDNAVEALAEQGVTLHVYDPYNRSQQHNRAAIKALRANGGADFAINSNVLNVIKEPEARLNVLENIKKITKPGAPIYITVYEGSGKGNEGVTKSGYQLNRKTADYLDEIKEVFPDAKRKGKLIIATNSGSVNSSTDIDTTERWAQRDLKDDIEAAISNLSFYCPVCHNKTLYSLENEIRSPMDVDYREIFVCDECASEFEAYPQYDGSIKFKEYYGEDVDASSRTVNSSTNIKASSEIIWDDLDWDEQIQVMKRYIKNYNGTRIFEDFADYINKPVEDIIDSFSDAESYGDIKIPERKQLDSEYRNDDIYSSITSSSRYWYFTRHGVQPGSVPKYVNILDIVDKPEGSYFLADGVILTKDLRDYDIKERKPEDSVTSSKRIKSKGNNQYTDADIVRSSKSIGKYFGLIYYTPDSGENGMEGDKFDLSDCGEFNSIEEANEFWHEYLLRDKGQAFVAEITKEEYEDWLAESELQKDWESSYKQSHGTVNGSTNEYSDILEEIREQCNTKLIHIMAQYGFDESEAKQYSRVDASIEDNQYGRIEIGCELDYDGLMRVCQELDPIVQAYDPDSYFEPVDSGIAEAWVTLEKASIDSSSNIQAGAYDFPEPSLDPPEYPEPEEVDDYTQKIDLNLDAVIEIDQLGDWEYQDENYPWARCKDTKDGSWYSDEYDVFIADPVSIVERVDELLISKLPEKEGTYRIKGNVHLEYVVSNLLRYVHSYGPDDYDEDIDTDNAYVDFDFYNSNISDFKLTKI